MEDSNAVAIEAINSIISISFSNHLSSVIKELSYHQEISSINEKIVDFLCPFLYLSDSIKTSLAKYSSLVKNQPAQCLQLIFRYFAKINVDIKEDLTQEKLDSSHYISRLKLTAAQKGSAVIRGIIYVFTDYLLASMIKCFLKIKDLNADYIFDFYFGGKLMEKIKDPNFSYWLKVLTMRKWEKIIRTLSLINQKRTFDCMITCLNAMNNVNNVMVFALNIFASISIKGIDTQTIENFGKSKCFKNILGLLKYSPCIGEEQYAAGFFLSNLIGCEIYENDRMTTKFFGIVKDTAVKNINSPCSFRILAIILCKDTYINNDINLVTLTKTGLKLIDETNNSGSIILTSYLQMISGVFKNRCQKMTEYKPCKTKLVTSIQTLIFQNILSYGSFSSFQKEMIELTTQFAVNDLETFYNQYFSSFKVPLFLSSNGSILFDFIKLILSLKWEDKREQEIIENIKKDAIAISKSLFSSNPANNGSVVYYLPNISCKPGEILKYSKPLLADFTPPKRFIDMSKWRTVFDTKKNGDFFTQQKSSILNTKYVIPKDENINHVIALLPLLEYDSNYISLLKSYLFDSSPLRSAVAYKTIQTMVSIHCDKREEILTKLLNDLPLTFEQIYIFTNLLTSILSRIDRESLEKYEHLLYPIIIYGLCTSSYEIRITIFELIEFVPTFNTLIKDDYTLFKDALVKMYTMISFEYDIGILMKLPYHSFHEFGASNYELIYNIFLSILFKNLLKTDIINKSIKLIIKQFNLILSKKNETKQTYFLVNLAMLILYNLTPENIESEENKHVFEVLPLIDNQYLFCSFFASIPPLISQVTLDMLLSPNDNYINALTYVCRWLLKNNQNYFNYLFNTFLPLINKLIILIDNEHIVSSKEVKPTNINNQIIEKYIIDILILIDDIFSKYKETNLEKVYGPFIRLPNVKYYDENVKIDYDSWYIFIYNLCNDNKQKIQSLASKSLHSFCSFAPICDKPYSIFMNNFIKLSKISIETCITIVSRSFQTFIPFLLKNSYKEPAFFVCISSQFDKIVSSHDLMALIADRGPLKMSQVDQDFFQIIYNNLGHLIALSMLYIYDIPGYFDYAFNIINHISFSCALIKNDSIDFIKLLQFLLKHSKSNLNYESLVELNVLLSKAFYFCSEQFLYGAMNILKNEYYSTFTGFLSEWMLNIKLYDNNNLGIISCNENQFLNFSSYTFIQSFLDAFCDSSNNSLMTSTIGLIDILISDDKNLETIFIICFHLYETHHDKSLRLLSYICKKQKYLVSYVNSLFEFKYWFYQQIQLGKVEMEVDFNKFMKFIGEKSQNEEKQQNEGDIKEYKNITNFALELTELINLEDTKPYVVSFILITRPSELKKRIMKRIFGTENASLTMMQEEFTTEQMITFSKLCFIWASSCGELRIAQNAINLSLCLIDYYYNEDMIDILIRTLGIYIQTIAEKNTIIISNAFANDCVINMKDVYQYLSSLIKLLSEINNKLEKPQERVFWIIAEFLSVSDNDFTGIFNSTIDGIYSYIRNVDKLTFVPSNYIGLIEKFCTNEIFLDPRIASQGLVKLCYSIIKLAIMKDYEVIIGSYENVNEAISIIVLLLIPYITTECPKDLIDQFASSISDFINISDEQPAEIINEELIKQLSENISPKYASIISHFYFILIKNVPTCSLSVYRICAYILTNENTNFSQELFGKIINLALRDKNEHLIEVECELIQLYQKKSAFTKQSINHPPSKFPLQKLPIMFDPKKWKINDEYNLQTKIEHLPPLCPVEQSLINYPYPKMIMNATIQYRIIPFTRWNDILYQTKSIEVSNEQIYEFRTKEVEISKESIDKYLNCIETKPINEQTNNQMNDINTTNDKQSKYNLLNCTIISNDIFTPNVEYIENVGYGEITNLQFPSIFIN